MAEEQTQAPRVGVYICHCGGNISDVVDVEAVAAEAAKLPNVVVSRDNTFMCSDPGQQMIAEDIENLGVDHVVVAACSPRLHTTTFRGVLERAGKNPFVYQNANIREQVSWSTHDHAEATTKATALVRAAVAKASLLQPLDPVSIPAAKRVLVVGGGVAGLRAAGDLAHAGLAVTLVERELVLGGRAALLDKLFPYEEPVEDVIRRLTDEVLAHPAIEVRTGTTVEQVSGYIGAFEATLRQVPTGTTVAAEDAPSGEAVDGVGGTASPAPARTVDGWRYETFRGFAPDAVFSAPSGDAPEASEAPEAPEAVADEGTSDRTFTRSVGAIVVATGFEHYTPPKGEYGYQRMPQVVTLIDFLEWLAQQPEGATPTFNDQPLRSVAFIHCVGSRQVDGVHKPGPNGKINEYCSRVCCTATLQAANDLRARFPRVAAYEFYQDIRAYGRGHEDYYERASNSGVVFLRYDGAQPPKVAKAKKGDDFPLTVTCTDSLTWGEEVEVGADLVVLAVGMTPADVGGLATSLKLPASADGFLQEVHPKLRPVEQSVNGVLLAGTCQAPKDVTESCASASAAAVKALGLLASGHVELDPFVAHVDAQRCEGHAACLAECPYDGAISMEEYGDGKKRAVVNPALCGGCGACVAVCPTGAIDLNGWSLETYEAMVDALLASGSEVAAR